MWKITSLCYQETEVKRFNFCESNVTHPLSYPSLKRLFIRRITCFTAAHVLLHPQQCRRAPHLRSSWAETRDAGGPQMGSGSCYAAWMSKCLPSQIASSPLIPAPFILAELSRCLRLHFIPSARPHLLCKYAPRKAASRRQKDITPPHTFRASANKEIRIIHCREWILLIKPSNPTLANLIQSLTISSRF